MELPEIMQILESLGSEQTKKVLSRHGAKAPFFGVKIADMKSKIVKKVKKNHNLAIALYDTGNSDAMYLAGLISEPDKMTRELLQKWVKAANWYMISEYTVAWVCSESKYALELALEWIDSAKEHIASSGWATLGSMVTIKEDEQLDIECLKGLLERVLKTINESPNRTRYTMNNFVIACGSCVLPLKEYALTIAENMGKIKVNMGTTACKVPFAPDYIRKVEEKGKLGNKKKSAVC